MAANANMAQALMEENNKDDEGQQVEEEEKVPENDDKDVDVEDEAHDPEVDEMLLKHGRRRGGLDHRTDPKVPDEDTGINPVNVKAPSNLMQLAGQKKE